MSYDYATYLDAAIAHVDAWLDDDSEAPFPKYAWELYRDLDILVSYLKETRNP
jgi:hypothetical protein